MPVRRLILLKIFISFVCLACVPWTVGFAAWDEAADAQLSWRDTLVQVSTLGALLVGFYDGVTDFETLDTYGDFGIGTFENLDGEMIGYEGTFYQIKADGVAYPVANSMTTPFACVTFFDADLEEHLLDEMGYQEFTASLDSILPTENIFYAIRVDGTFRAMKTRSVPAQQKPYPPLSEVTARQSVFEFTDVEGTVVGFRCPAYVDGINVPGYHLHFLTKDRSAGGHVLDFTIKEAVVSVDYTASFLMILPEGEPGFYDLDLTQDTHKEVEKVEK